MAIVIEKAIHEESLSQPLQTDIKLLKIAVTFLTGYNGIINISFEKFQFITAIDVNDFTETTNSPGSHELEILMKKLMKLNELLFKTLNLQK